MLTNRFNVNRMIDEAQRQTGLADWGDEGFREPLTILVHALNEEARLNEIGFERTKLHLDNILVQRLKLVEDRKRFPQIAKQEIKQPLFLTGMPRAGTSLLNSLLAQDPANLPTLHWQMWCPSPPPNCQSIDHRPQIERARYLLDFQGHTSPVMRERHHYDALNAEEDGHICEYSLLCSDYVAYWNVPSYLRYLSETSYVPSYQWHKRVLQALQFGTERRRWTLKAPGHIYHLEPLLEVYPDAKFVVNHRDPARVLASVLSMTAVHWDLFGNKPLRHDRELALYHMEGTAAAWESVIELRQNPELNDRFLDLTYVDLEREPLAQAERVYAHLGAELSATARRAMLEFFARNRKGKFGKHAYRLADYSLTAKEVRERFRPYLERFSVPVEADV